MKGGIAPGGLVAAAAPGPTIDPPQVVYIRIEGGLRSSTRAHCALHHGAQRDKPRPRLEAAMAHQAKAALQSFSLANDITNISPQDEIYKYDVEENKKILRAEPWKSE